MPQTIVITGASMGIGRALALAWARDAKEAGDTTLVLSARGRKALEDVAKEVEAAGEGRARAVIVDGDVTNDAHRAELVAQAGEHGGVSVLVNNAGRGFHAPALKVDLDEMRRLFELNVVAPLHLVQLAAPQLEKTKGTIVMMSSIAGVVAAPKYAAYAASKFALEAIAMSMRSELAELGIGVVVIRPGPVDTPFRTNAVIASGETGYDAPDPNAQSPDVIARLTLRAVKRGTPVVETSNFVRAASLGVRIAPPILRRVLRGMAKKKS